VVGGECIIGRFAVVNLPTFGSMDLDL